MPQATCKVCGGSDLRTVSESVTEVLSYVPARFEVIRHVRPACSCRKCETMVQAPMPDLPIPRGMVDASFLAHMIVAKFCDHIPLYCQAEIDARTGVEIDRSQRAEWFGHMAWLLSPLVELTAAQVMAGRVLQADDTLVDVLAPGTGKTKTGRIWVYLRDERPHAGTAPPAVLYRYARSRWPALTRYLDDGRLEISNNAAENKIRPAALGRKNWLFCGSDAGGTRAAAFYTLIGTARMNGIEPEAWLTDVIARIGAHPIKRLAELLPWNWHPPATLSVAT